MSLSNTPQSTQNPTPGPGHRFCPGPRSPPCSMGPSGASSPTTPGSFSAQPCWQPSSSTAYPLWKPSWEHLLSLPRVPFTLTFKPHYKFFRGGSPLCSAFANSYIATGKSGGLLYFYSTIKSRLTTWFSINWAVPSLQQTRRARAKHGTQYHHCPSLPKEKKNKKQQKKKTQTNNSGG